MDWGDLGRRKILVTCSKGIPSLLSREMKSLGFSFCREAVAAVETEGTLEECMGLNLFLRTGQRVLFFLEEFQAGNADALYSAVTHMKWEDMLLTGGYLSVTSSVENPTIRDSRYANLKCKDAIVDRMVRKCGRRPDSGPGRSGAVIHLYWKDKQCQIYLDTSGEPLSRRGYRKIPLKAPMQETLAAAVVLSAEWRSKEHFVNPMCGSGTLAIEAALIADHQPPGLLKRHFGFMSIKGFRGELWEKLVRKSRAEMGVRPGGRIIATDISPQAVKAARQNAAAAGVLDQIEFQVCPFEETPVPLGEGVVLLNPEYGERLGDLEKLAWVYRGIGDFFKKKCQGYRGYIFTGNLELAKRVGLRARRRIPFFNSNIECRLLEYELYPGSRRIQNEIAIS
jgi:putative N6-adenine-specific DNA methylase